MSRLNFKILNGLIIVNSNLDGINGQLIFDTGSSKSTLNLTYFKEHENAIVEEKEITIVYNGETVKKNRLSGTININKAIIDNTYEINRLNAILMDLTYVEKPLKTIDKELVVLGTIGMDFISNHLFTIDYINGDFKSNEIVEIEFTEKELIVINAIFDKGVIRKFILDSGASVCTANDDLKPYLGECISEPQKLYFSKKFKTLNKVYDHIMFQNIDSRNFSNDFEISGIIGYPCLVNLKITIDCKNKKIYL